LIKRTLYFGNAAYLSKKDAQFLVRFPTEEAKNPAQIPIEDIGMVILDHYQVSITQGLLAALLANNCAVLSCAENHMPAGLFMNMEGGDTMQETFRAQLESTEPLRKNLWQQTVQAKIRNQMRLLQKLDIPADNMKYWADSVKSGDTDNHEARAAAYYWQQLFAHLDTFDEDFENLHPGRRRHRTGDTPNPLLNYGYAVLRAIIARSLLGSGLLTVMGIHHRNRYNPFCLADDIMEPYRPYVDALALKVYKQFEAPEELTPDIKRALLEIPTLEVSLDDQKGPLMVMAARTTASLARCYLGEQRKILYPDMV
jgi:CRISPR-associated protein Cas1